MRGQFFEFNKKLRSCDPIIIICNKQKLFIYIFCWCSILKTLDDNDPEFAKLKENAKLLVNEKIEDAFAKSIKRLNSYNRGQAFIILKNDAESIIASYKQIGLSHNDDLVVLELVLEKFVKALRDLLMSVHFYKESLSYLSNYTLKKEYLCVLLNAHALDTNKVKELKRNIVSLTQILYNRLSHSPINIMDTKKGEMGPYNLAKFGVETKSDPI